MKVNNFLILTARVPIYVFCVSTAFCDVPPPSPIIINLNQPDPNQAAIDAAKAAADAATQQAAADASAKAAADAAAQQAAIDASAKAAIDASAKAAADAAAQQAAQKTITDAAAAVVAAQVALNGGAIDPTTQGASSSMSINAAIVDVLKNNAVSAANKLDATTQSTAAQNIAKKVMDAAAIIQKAFDTVNASLLAAPGNPDVTKAVSDVAQLKATSDGIVTAVNADVAMAIGAVSTKP